MEVAVIVFVTAIVFTIVGKMMYKESIRDVIIQKTIAKTTDLVISRLIKDGYIKTEGTGDNLNILKHDE